MRLQQILLTILFMFPVIGAYQFNLEGSFLGLASALISVILWVALGQLLMRMVSQLQLRVTVGIVFYTVLAFYIFGQLISYYLQGTYYNSQYFFHMNLASLTETWDVNGPMFGMFLVWLAFIWLLVWRGRKTAAGAAVSAWLLPVLLFFAVVLDPGLRSSMAFGLETLSDVPDESLEAIEWEELHLQKGALQKVSQRAKPGKNLVLLYMEGFDRLYTDQEVFPGLAPSLAALGDQGWQLDNLVQMKGTGWTMAGLVSSMCGTPLLHEWEFGGNNIMFTQFLNRASCLPDVLRSAGYQQTFMGGASLEFAGKGKFLRQHSFDDVLGRKVLLKKLPDPKYRGEWGLYDESLLDLGLEEFDRLANLKMPFNLTMLTVDTHHPKGEPSKSCPKYRKIDNSVLHAVHCTDFLVGRFISRLQEHPAYENTVVVLVADHLAMRNDAYSLFPKGYKRRLYFNVLNAGVVERSQVFATHMDIAPTVLSLLDVEHRSSFLAGINLTAPPVEPRIIDPRNRKRNNTLGFLNSNYLTSGADTERESILVTREDLEFANEIENVEVVAGKIKFLATGTDPYIMLPKVKSRDGKSINVTLDIDLPAATQIRVLYITSEARKYRQSRFRGQNARKGNNRITFPLPAEADFGALRLDPGAVEGEYTINSIEIQL